MSNEFLGIYEKPCVEYIYTKIIAETYDDAETKFTDWINKKENILIQENIIIIPLFDLSII